MLLTSSQVSVAVSSGIVLFFTAALFLSGYAIQQRTLRDLRRAIKPSPRPSPKIFLPDRFKKSTTELPDGSVVAVDDPRDAGSSRTQQVIEVKPSMPKIPQHSESHGSEQQAVMGPLTKKDAKAADKKSKKDKKSKDESKPEKPISRAERRRRIKEEIQKLAQGEQRGYYQRRLW
ncbi:hypothetical protein OQA88_4958 [Cercophora sp. LCS_1]